MRKYKNQSNSASNGLVMRLLDYALTKFIIPFVILLMRVLAYAIITFIIPFVINIIKTKLGGQQPLLCTKCHRKLEVIDKANLYCRNCKIIKFDPDPY